MENPIGNHFGAHGNMKMPQMSAQEPFERKTGNTDKLRKHGGTQVKGRTKRKEAQLSRRRKGTLGEEGRTRPVSKDLCLRVSQSPSSLHLWVQQAAQTHNVLEARQIRAQR